MTELTGDTAASLTLYLTALEVSPGLALEIIPRVLNLAKLAGEGDVLGQLARRLQRNGRVSGRQLAWLLATALPAQDVRQLPAITEEFGAGVDSEANAASLGALLTRIGDSGARYQCDDCGLHSVGWYWHCPKCRSWDSMRPAVFKWAERTDEAARAS
jgi:lipopolysaccharide biosynthesis regulator YciM